MQAPAFQLVFVAFLSACSPPPRAPARAQCVPALVAPTPAVRAETPVANTGRAALLAAVHAITEPVAADGSSYAQLALGAEMPAVIALSPLLVRPGEGPVGDAFPERFVTARFPESATIASADVLDGIVIAIRAHGLLDAADATRDPIADGAAMLAELGPRFGAPDNFSVEPERCTFWFRFPHPNEPASPRGRLKVQLAQRELSVELRGREKGASLIALQEEAGLVIAQRERASVCAECRRVHAGQQVGRWYTIVSVDLSACTMKVKQMSWGMQREPAGRKLGELSEIPCSGDNGY